MPYRCLRWWFSRDTPPIWNMRRTVCLQCHNDLQMVRVRPSDSSGFVVGRVWWFVRIFLPFHGVRACGARPVIARPRTHPCHREATHSPRHREATHSPRHREATYSPRHREAMHSPRHREAVRPWRSMTSCPHGLPRFARNDSLASGRGCPFRHRVASGQLFDDDAADGIAGAKRADHADLAGGEVAVVAVEGDD